MFLFFLSSLLKTSRRPVTCFLFPPVFQMKVPPQSSLFFSYSSFVRGEREGGGGYEVICHLSPPPLSLCTILVGKKGGKREYNLGSCPSSFQWGEGGRREEKGPLPNPTAFLSFLPPSPTRKPVCCLHPTYGPTLRIAAQAAATAAAVGSTGVFTQKNLEKAKVKSFFKKNLLMLTLFFLKKMWEKNRGRKEPTYCSETHVWP